MKLRDLVDWNVYWLLFMVAEFSLLLALPYSISVSTDMIYDLGGSLPNVLAVQFARSTILFLLFIFIGLYLGKKVGLGAPFLGSLSEGKGLDKSFFPSVKLSIFLGALTGAIIFILSWLVFSMSTEPFISLLLTPPLWQRFLYSFYAAAVEEILLRYFLMTLFVWISWKIRKTSENRPTNTGIWLSILLVSLIYGSVYLISPSTMDVGQLQIWGIVILNVIAGTVFGWLYWKKGLEAAFLANLTTSLMILVVLGSLF
ncbi:CPBP family glutamic-type intramembrane protease [Methanolobus psychrotolerans]|uniref:CPBP family glutamic-type intramembrane protease n=1 Tax=Methanolobus psychrotolerans TaxID=1874706 RepID=UPI000B91B2B9|nr:CPBP family glutamic-type intramembrane protease [Methanolobus psychrotolerans]